MKKYLLFLCVFVILGACTNTIGYLPDDEPKKLIVNAMMQTENNDNRIYLHYTGWTATTPVTDGIIHLYINGKLSETITAEDDYYPVNIIRKTKCFDFWERNVLFPKTKRSFFRTPTLPFST